MAIRIACPGGAISKTMLPLSMIGFGMHGCSMVVDGSDGGTSTDPPGRGRIVNTPAVASVCVEPPESCPVTRMTHESEGASLTVHRYGGDPEYPFTIVRLNVRPASVESARSTDVMVPGPGTCH